MLHSKRTTANIVQTINRHTSLMKSGASTTRKHVVIRARCAVIIKHTQMYPDGICHHSTPCSVKLGPHCFLSITFPKVGHILMKIMSLCSLQIFLMATMF